MSMTDGEARTTHPQSQPQLHLQPRQPTRLRELTRATRERLSAARHLSFARILSSVEEDHHVSLTAAQLHWPAACVDIAAEVLHLVFTSFASLKDIPAIATTHRRLQAALSQQIPARPGEPIEFAAEPGKVVALSRAPSVITRHVTNVVFSRLAPVDNTTLELMRLCFSNLLVLRCTMRPEMYPVPHGRWMFPAALNELELTIDAVHDLARNDDQHWSAVKALVDATGELTSLCHLTVRVRWEHRPYIEADLPSDLFDVLSTMSDEGRSLVHLDIMWGAFDPGSDQDFAYVWQLPQPTIEAIRLHRRLTRLFLPFVPLSTEAFECLASADSSGCMLLLESLALHATTIDAHNVSLLAVLSTLTDLHPRKFAVRDLSFLGAFDALQALTVRCEASLPVHMATLTAGIRSCTRLTWLRVKHPTMTVAEVTGLLEAASHLTSLSLQSPAPGRTLCFLANLPVSFVDRLMALELEHSRVPMSELFHLTSLKCLTELTVLGMRPPPVTHERAVWNSESKAFAMRSVFKQIKKCKIK